VVQLALFAVEACPAAHRGVEVLMAL
jgi:hypothetical protein